MNIDKKAEDQFYRPHFGRTAPSLLAMTAVLCLTTVPAAAAAQDAPAVVNAVTTQSAAPAASDSTKVGDIVVTAQRRSESLQRVPMSITAVNSEQLANLGIQRLKDIELATPQLRFSEQASYSLIHVRGIGTTFANPGLESAVATYVDGVPLQVSLGGVFDALDIETIQVLEGPQGTLYGRNASGGAILVNTANPTDREEGRLFAEYGSLDHKQFEAMINQPITSNLNARVAGRVVDENGYIRNIHNNNKIGGRTEYVVRGKLDWAATDRLSFLLSSEYMHRTDDSGQIFQLVEGGQACAVCSAFNVQPATGFYEINVDQDRRWRSKYSFNILKAALDLDDHTITNIVSYRDQEMDTTPADVDLTPADFFTFESKLRNRTFTEELQVASNYGGPLNFIAGAFYLHDKQNYNNELGGLQFGGLSPQNSSVIITDSYSAFLDVNFNVTEALKLTVGGRYNYDKKKITGVNNADATLVFGIPNFSPAPVDFKSFTPRVVLSYQTDLGNFYASYNKGFKSGGLVTPAFSDIPPVRPEKIWSAEVGAKLAFADGRVRLNLAAFHYKITDLQVQTVIYPTGSVTTNAAAAKGDGVNVGLQLALTDGLRLGAGVGYLDARYSDYVNAPLYEPTPGGTGYSVIPIALGSDEPDLTGFPLESAPKWSGYVSASYETELTGGWRGGLSAIARYNSAFDFRSGGQSRDRQARQQKYATVNLTGFIETPDEKYRIGFYVRNLVDKKYDLLRQVTNFGTFHTAALPRTYGVNVQYKF